MIRLWPTICNLDLSNTCLVSDSDFEHLYRMTALRSLTLKGRAGTIGRQHLTGLTKLLKLTSLKIRRAKVSIVVLDMIKSSYYTLYNMSLVITYNFDLKWQWDFWQHIHSFTLPHDNWLRGRQMCLGDQIVRKKGRKILKVLEPLPWSSILSSWEYSRKSASSVWLLPQKDRLSHFCHCAELLCLREWTIHKEFAFLRSRSVRSLAWKPLSSCRIWEIGTCTCLESWNT